jgi:hypothetical protein
MRVHVLENAGDLAGAVTAAERALALLDEADGPWAAAILHTELERHLPPAAQQIQLARSQSAYYRMRREAIQSLVDLLAHQHEHALIEHTLGR